jgi:WD40 repeat protein
MRKLLFLLSVVLFASHNATAQDLDSSKLPLQIGHSENINTLSWSPDNTKLLSHSWGDSSIRLWDVKTGRQLWSVNAQFIQKDLETSTLISFDWSPDQKLIASTGYNGRVQLWDAGTGKLLWMIEAHKGNGQEVKFTPNGEYLISIAQPEDADGEIKLWDVRTGKLVRRFIGKADEISSARFDRSGRLLTTGSTEGEVSVWNVGSGRKVSSKKFNPCGSLKQNPQGLGYSPDLNLLVGRCSEKTTITNFKTGKVVRILDMRTDSEKEVGFSRDEKILVLTNSGDYMVLNLGNNQISKIEDMINSGFTYELNSDGSLLAEGGGYKAEGIQITDVKTGKPVIRLESHPGIINSLAFNPDGSHFASGSTDRILRIWETETKNILFALSGHTDEILSVEYSRDGKQLTSKSENETITWDAVSGKKLSEEKESANGSDELKKKVESLSGKYQLIDLDEEKPFQLIDAHNGNLIREFEGLTQIQGFEFTPDEKQFLSAAYFYPLQLWDIESGKKLRDFDIGYSSSNVITFSPDGKTFITGGWNQNILMYELGSGKLLWSLFPIDQEEMQAQRAEEARRIKYLRDKDEFEKRADREMETFKGKVYITFDHYGDMTPLGEQRIAESDEPNKSRVKKSAEDSDAIWLRLHNDSPLPISVPTQNMYLPNPKCFYKFPSGNKVLGLCDNREISVWLGLEDKNGKQLPYGFDFGSSVILLPKTSVLFAVPRDRLNDGDAIRFGFTFQNETTKNKVEPYGTAKILRYREADLPKPE